jgi:ketosteroid isomerase-like protein
LNEFGGPFEIEILTAVIVSGGRLCRIEWFPVSEFAAAVNRFEELTARQEIAVPDYLVNTATRRAAELHDHLTRGDRDALEAATAEGVVVDDRRSLIHYRWSGQEQAVQHAMSVREAGVRRFVNTPLAVRGDRIALLRSLARGRDGEVELLQLIEFEAAGRWLYLGIFDPDDLDAAFDELDAHYAAGEAAAHAATWSEVCQSVAAWNSRDGNRIKSRYTDDFTFVDHRPLGFGTLNRAGWVESVRSLAELSPDYRLRVVAVLELADGGAALIRWLTGSQVVGGDFDSPAATVVAFREGRCHRFEAFALDDAARALDCLHALTTADQH